MRSDHGDYFYVPGEPMTIDSTTFRLTDDQYYKTVTPKSRVYIHHTVGGSAESTFNYWQSTADHVATAYIIERDGHVYEVFDPRYWAHHLGLSLPYNTEANQTSIGIELASEGALRSGDELNVMLTANGAQPRFDAMWLYAFDIDPLKDKSADQWFRHAKKLYNIGSSTGLFYDHGKSFRGYRFFDDYDAPQVAACNWLARHLCDTHGVPRQLLPNALRWTCNPQLATSFSGVLTHINVRADKSDVHPNWNWGQTGRVLSA